MDHIVNEYRYTEDVVEEGVGAWWKGLRKQNH